MRVVFVTGTDTSAGKTAVAGLLTATLQSNGSSFQAVKPFCSGERTDAELLCDLQQGKLSIDEVNPFYFREPLSPWTAARRAGRRIHLDETLQNLRSRECDLLLIEGAGGLLAPLGERFTAVDIIVALKAEVILVAANRLGVLNHTLLTLDALQNRRITNLRLALVDVGARDTACVTNEADLRLLCPGVEIHLIPYLENYKTTSTFIRGAAASLQPVLSSLLR